MKRNKRWLEQKIEDLNNWLQAHTELHFEYKLKVQNRNYYVNKLIEMEENNLKYINI